MLPRRIKHWSLTTLREKLIKTGARIVRHARYVTFQMAEVAVPRALFEQILVRIARLTPLCDTGSSWTVPFRATPVAWPGRLAPGVGPIPWPASLRAAQSTQGPFLTPFPRRNMTVASQSGRICGKARPTRRSTGESRLNHLTEQALTVPVLVCGASVGQNGHRQHHRDRLGVAREERNTHCARGYSRSVQSAVPRSCERVRSAGGNQGKRSYSLSCRSPSETTRSA